MRSSIDVHWENGSSTLAWTFADTHFRMSLEDILADPPAEEEPEEDASEETADGDADGDADADVADDDAALGTPRHGDVVDARSRPGDRLDAVRDVHVMHVV